MKEKKMVSKLKLKEAVALVIGVIIGSGVFFKASIVFKSAGNIYLGFLAWIVGALITICAGLTIAEISATIPKAGGLFTYLKEIYGDKIAFLYGWVQSIIYYPAIIAASAIIFSKQLAYMLGLNTRQQIIMALALIIFMSVIQCISVKAVGKIQVISTVIKLLPLLVIIILGFINGSADNSRFLLEMPSGENASGFGSALIAILWAYDGWITIGIMGAEMEKPEKNIPRSIILGLGVVTVCYILFNVALVKVLPLNEIIASDKVASQAAIVLLGGRGATFISIGILISVFGALNGNLLSGSRMIKTMAEDKLLPGANKLSIENKSLKTPVNSIIFLCIISCLYVLTNSFDMLTNLVVFVLWMFFVMGVLAIFPLRKRFGISKDTFKVPFYPVIPILAAIGGGYVIINTLLTDTLNAFIGILLTLTGIPMFNYLTKTYGNIEINIEDKIAS